MWHNLPLWFHLNQWVSYAVKNANTYHTCSLNSTRVLMNISYQISRNWKLKRSQGAVVPYKLIKGEACAMGNYHQLNNSIGNGHLNSKSFTRNLLFTLLVKVISITCDYFILLYNFPMGVATKWNSHFCAKNCEKKQQLMADLPMLQNTELRVGGKCSKIYFLEQQVVDWEYSKPLFWALFYI